MDQKHGEADWDSDADDYDAMVDSLEPELGKATKVLLAAAKIKPGMALLDLACGPGHTTAAAHAAGAMATGLDSSPAMIEIARRRFPGPKFVLGDMLEPPPGPWDAIVCRMGAHHVDSAWLAAAFAVLKPTGRLAIAETDALDEARPRGMLPAAEWVALFEAAGLVDVAVAESGANLSALPEDTTHFGGSSHAGHGRPDGPIYVISGRACVPGKGAQPCNMRGSRQ